MKTSTEKPDFPILHEGRNGEIVYKNQSDEIFIKTSNGVTVRIGANPNYINISWLNCGAIMIPTNTGITIEKRRRKEISHEASYDYNSRIDDVR